MLFQDAVQLIYDGYTVQRKNRKGGRIIVKSRAHAYAKMGLDDWMAEDWEIYHGKVEPLSSSWLPP